MDIAAKRGLFEPFIVRVGRVNVIVLTAALVVCSVVDIALFPGLLVGWLLALANLLGLWWTIKRGVGGRVKRIKHFTVMRYYLRLVVTVGVIGLLVIREIVNPWCLLTGFIVTSAVTIIFLIYNAKEGGL